jgi:hypothetical protein
VSEHIRRCLQTDGSLDPRIGDSKNCAPLAAVLPRYDG